MTERIGLALVAAMGENRVIGRDGALPWKISSDLKRFRAVTIGKPLLMGRKTWQSLPGALPGRQNLVVSRSPLIHAPGGWVFSHLTTALESARAMARRSQAAEVCCIGGAELYAALLPLADRIYLSVVHVAPTGDAWFPAIDPSFVETARERIQPGPNDDHSFTWHVLERKRS